MAMQFSAEERAAISQFRQTPQTQKELRDFMRDEGIKFGGQLALTITERSAGLLLSNSGRVGIANIVALQFSKQTARLRRCGHDDVGVDIYISAAKAELEWLGLGAV